MKDLVQCPICLEAFTDPRVLTCLHTLCHTCLSDHIKLSGKNGQFHCPECRKTLRIPTDGANGFPKNFFINNYMSIVADIGTGARSKTVPASNVGRQEPLENRCSNFEAGDNCTQAEQLCRACCEYFCEGCSKVLQGHILVPIRDKTEEKRRCTQLKQMEVKPHLDTALLVQPRSMCNTFFSFPEPTKLRKSTGQLLQIRQFCTIHMVNLINAHHNLIANEHHMACVT